VAPWPVTFSSVWSSDSRITVNAADAPGPRSPPWAMMPRQAPSKMACPVCIPRFIRCRSASTLRPAKQALQGVRKHARAGPSGDPLLELLAQRHHRHSVSAGQQALRRTHPDPPPHVDRFGVVRPGPSALLHAGQPVPVLRHATIPFPFSGSH